MIRITLDHVINSIVACIYCRGELWAVYAVVQLIQHIAALDVALIDEYMRPTVVGQTGIGCWWFVLRVLFTVIYHRKICFKPFTVKVTLCHIFTWILQILVIVNKIRVGDAPIYAFIILNGRLLDLCHVLGPIIGIRQHSLRGFRNLCTIIFFLGSADLHSCRIVLVVTGTCSAYAGNRNCGYIYICIFPAVGMRADSKIKGMYCM